MSTSEITLPGLHEHKFFASWLDIEWLTFPGYTDGKTWNGWEEPWFTKEVADHYVFLDAQLRADIRRQNEAGTSLAEDGDVTVVYDADKDAYIITDHTISDDEDGIIECPGIIVNGMKLYNLGNYWVWEADDEECHEQGRHILRDRPA